MVTAPALRLHWPGWLGGIGFVGDVVGRVVLVRCVRLFNVGGGFAAESLRMSRTA
jgi:hypothetical protein